MEIWLFICVIVFFLAVHGYFVASWWRTRAMAKKVEAEATKNGEDFYSQTGGVRLDNYNATIPFAAIVITGLKIFLLLGKNEYVYEKFEINSLSCYRGYFSTGLQINHRKEDPSFVVFWTTHFNELREELKRLGYEVEE